MILDYKDYDKIVSHRKKSDRFSVIIAVVLGIVVIIGLLYAISWKNNYRLQNLLSTLKCEEARQYVDSHYYFFHRSNAHEANALLELVEKKFEPAEYYFSNNEPGRFPDYWNKYVDLFIKNGDYRYGMLYLTYLKKKFTYNDIEGYHCIVSTILNNFASANNCLENARNISSLKKYAEILSAVEQKKRFNWIVDRHDNPLVYKKTGSPDYFYSNEDIAWLKPDMLALEEKDYYNTLKLTLDAKLQKYAYDALGNYHGTLLLMKKDGQLLAAVSKIDDKGEPLFIRLLKPGSIVKIVTSSAAMRNNIDLSKIFPLECKGFIVPYEKKIFYDWLAHEKVESIVEALASSCNVSFGIIGNYVKEKKLMEELDHFGINKTITMEGMKFPAGKVLPNPSDPIYEYSLAIGDNYIQITPVLALLWVSAIINDGIAMIPFFLKSAQSIADVSYKAKKGEILSKFTNKDYLEPIYQGMIDAVEKDFGTGKRAKLEQYRIALKTGTAGEKDPAYDAIIIGYAPAEKPQIVFVMFALSAGKASLEGTRIIKEFLASALPYYESSN
ncbi:MAG: hypothetical protein A2Y62_15605 [Candidatus Fischerbacteria bacterium RBG_13_37_8]|uniref:beta-lactamase n=1 Tax=Candidatus Fischerbacteria bacterium RBG_13_37_8 TaxID=1817863 RepID=A0A1F5VL48_9BACT|nr:MAG: hypothetical protein A2Y62_15605 [Candidatus Fischerbacteria bacterium RBG_13_37_8]